METIVLLPRSDEGSSKKYKKSKKANDEIPSKESPKKIMVKSPKKRTNDKEQEKKKVVKQIEVSKTASLKEEYLRNHGYLKY